LKVEGEILVEILAS